MPPIKHAGPLKRTTLVDQLVESLCQDIFLGSLSPGEQLPPIRQLAVHYGVTVPTLQRAIARLEQMGLVETRQGSGMTVLDPMTCADPTALCAWLAALEPRPAAARRLVADVLELRRGLMVTLLIKIREQIKAPAFQAVRASADRLMKTCAQKPTDRAAILEAEVNMIQSLLMLQPQRAFGTVFNSVHRFIRSSNALQRALYADPEQAALTWKMILGFLKSSRQNEDLRWLISTVLMDQDNAALDRFEHPQD
jgi:DNA-binding FadR family transcriptional regulator